ncbi:MAG: type VI secretion system-associated FHA domain protein TagH [Ketobacteraceae bacterium]|nr:type VI secretion system-associated FHA domain protein TagH [Ketobacteraceae bacterium]
MPLVLTIVRQPEGGGTAETRKLFDESGGTLGRASDNSWSLPDPSRFVSSHHASIRYDRGDFYLVDTSTNGVFVNNSSNPLGTGNQVRLQQGDTLCLGEYEIQVEFEQASGGADAMSNDDFDQWLDPDSQSGAVQSSDDSDLLTPEQELLDPLAALDKASAGHSGSQWGGSSQSDNAEVPNQAFVPPNPIPESDAPATSSRSAGNGGIIPDDWDIDDLLGDDTPAPRHAPRPATPAPAATASAPQPDNQADLSDDIDALLEGDDDLGPVADAKKAKEVDELDAFLGLDGSEEPEERQASEPDPEPETPAEPVAAPQPGESSLVPDPAARSAPRIPEPPKVPESALSQSQSGPAPQAPPYQTPQPRSPQSGSPEPPARASELPGQQAAAGGQDCDGLIRSLGLDPERMNDSTREHFQKVLADTLRETVAGMMKVLGARNAIKNEFRMNVTMIQPMENNPLKFSPNVDEALRNMFTSQSNAYLPGTIAIRDGFADVADHQVAVIAGMRAAFRSLLKRFDPADLEVRFDKQHKAGLLSSKKGKYWEAYHEFYRDLSDNMDDAFQDLFGEDFAEAYEQQMSRLEAARKK